MKAMKDKLRTLFHGTYVCSLRSRVGVMLFSGLCWIVPSYARTLALYTCEEGVAGQSVERLVNQLNPGTHDGKAYVNDLKDGGSPGNMPCYTNSVSGNCIYSDAMCTQIVVRAPLAVHFSSPYSDLASGGSIDLEGLARALRTAGTKRFTIELFWRSDENADPRLGAIVSFNDWFRGRLATGEYGEYIAMYNREGYKLYRLGESEYLRYQGWRHWAITVDATDDAKGVGCIYYDYVKMGEQTDFVNGTDVHPDIRLGAALWDSVGTRNGGACARGDMACIRVSDEALTPEKFMRMGVAAFYPFTDRDPGEDVETVTNSIVVGDATGIAGCHNKMPVFSSDRPGRYVFSSVDKQELIGSDIQSIDFKMKDQYTQSHGFIDFEGLAGRMLMTLRPNAGVTIECFFKREYVAWGNLNILSMGMPASIGDTFSVRVNSSSIVADTRYSYDDSRVDTTCSNSGETFLNDGRWHHLAIVIGDTTRQQTQYRGVSVYVDYFKDSASVPGRIQYVKDSRYEAWCDLPLTLGHFVGHTTSKNGFVGKIAALRVTSMPLSPDRFMVASDTLEKPSSKNVIRWRFEEGDRNAQMASIDSDDISEAWTKGVLTTFGEVAVAPIFTSERVAGRMKDGGSVFPNHRSLMMSATDSASGATVENKIWCGMPCLHPESWTMEVFVKSGADSRAADALLFGRGRINPASLGESWYDWALVLQPDGLLALKGYRVGETKTPYAFNDLGRSLDDGLWHRIVVSHDGAEHRYNVWLDEMKILDQVLESAQVDSTDGRYQLAFGGRFGGFGGFMDEVRLVDCVLDRDEFTVPHPTGMVVVVR